MKAAQILWLRLFLFSFKILRSFSTIWAGLCEFFCLNLQVLFWFASLWRFFIPIFWLQWQPGETILIGFSLFLQRTECCEFQTGRCVRPSIQGQQCLVCPSSITFCFILCFLSIQMPGLLQGANDSAYMEHKKTKNWSACYLKFGLPSSGVVH